MWKQWWPYKALAFLAVLLLAGANCLMTLDTVADYIGDPELEYTHGVRASVFALTAAAFLFIRLLPNGGWVQDEVLDFWCRVISVAAAFGAGLFWVLDETAPNHGPYILVLGVVTGVLAAVLISILVGQWVADRVRRRPDA